MSFKNQTIEGYEFKTRLGKGSFGEVWKVTKDSKDYAIKVVNNADDPTGAMEQFVADKIRFLSPFLVQYYKSFRQDDFLFIVMELCDKGDVAKLLAKLDKAKGITLNTSRIMKVLLQMVLGLHEIHSNNMIHRDIKPENIFINADDDIKMGDFGCMKILEATLNASTYVGTQLYMSPEIISGKPYNNKTDIWSLGVMMYHLCTLTLPFHHSSPFLVPSLILAGKFEPIPKYTVADEIINIIHSMLDLNPVKRPSTLDLLRQPIMHSFAQTFDMVKYFPAEVEIQKPSDKVSDTKDGKISSRTPTPTPTPSPSPSPPPMEPNKTFIWREPKIDEEENSRLWETLKTQYGEKVNLFAVKDNESAFGIIDKKRNKTGIYVASSRRMNGPGFLQQCRDRGVPNPAVIYCGNADFAVPAWITVGVTEDTLSKFIEGNVLGLK